MNGWDILILIAVIALLAFAVWLNVHKKEKGSGCCGDCEKCRKDCTEPEKKC